MKPQRKMRGKDARGAQKREAEWLAANAPQRCIVCGKWFVRRADKVCSRDCLEKLSGPSRRQRGSDRTRSTPQCLV
jgi:hypothetical protein